jgi:aconitase A
MTVEFLKLLLKFNKFVNYFLAIMSRGTFANIRLVNKFMPNPGPKTIHFPSNEEMDIFDCAMRYKDENVPLILLAGAEVKKTNLT